MALLTIRTFFQRQRVKSDFIFVFAKQRCTIRVGLRPILTVPTIYKNKNVFFFVITIHTALRQVFLYRNENHFCCPSAHNHILNESVAQFCSSKPNYKNETEFQIPYKSIHVHQVRDVR